MLSALAVENAKPRGEPYLLTDGRGLHLLVTPQGRKLWRLRYRFGDKQNMLSLGLFPDVLLASARTKRDEARDGSRPLSVCFSLGRPVPRVPALVNEGFDPSQQFAKLVLIDQKIDDGSQRAQRENELPHGVKPLQVRPYVEPCSQTLMLPFRRRPVI